jgi:DNA-binding CsgD family transcriptional regulator
MQTDGCPPRPDRQFPNLQLERRRALRRFGIDVERSLRLWQRDMVGPDFAAHIATLEPENSPLSASGLDLSEREREVLTLAACGLSYREAGEILHISRETIKSHHRTIKRKFHASTVTKAVVMAILVGELDNDLLRKHFTLPV